MRAAARNDACDSLLNLNTGHAGFGASLAAIEKQAALFEARANAIEQIAEERAAMHRRFNIDSEF